MDGAVLDLYISCDRVDIVVICGMISPKLSICPFMPDTQTDITVLR